MFSFTRKFSLLLGLFLAGPLYAEAPVILIVGDSLSAGYGMELDQAWPRLLQKRLDDNGHEYRVFNSSITGDTTQGALARLPRLLERQRPRWVILELGGNDGLRGIGIDVTRANFVQMIEQSRAVGAQVMLTGIRLPPNYGPTYTERFHAMYGELADQYGLLLVPFFMEGVALEPELMQEDGIHPNAAAQPVLLDHVWTVLEPALQP
ncbi:MAG: arylesterase [Xanthomonadales bacterium]|nr:arylesterase [Xanthomonadales bacterium]NIX12968.1 arylesterase [Xanthomonadales bacterium]